MNVPVGIALLQALRSYGVGFVLWVLFVTQVVMPVDRADPTPIMGGLRGIGAIAAFFLLTQFARVIWPMRIPRSKPWRLVAGGRSYAIHSYTGRASGVMKLPITELNHTASVSYDPSLQYSQSRATVRVTSRTRMFDQFTLAGADGTQRSFQVMDANVALSDGQVFSTSWAVRPLSRGGRYVQFVNHSADAVTLHAANLGSLARGTRWGFFGLAVVTCAVAFGISLSPYWFVGGLALVIAFRVLSWVQVSLFALWSSRRLTRTLDEVAQRPDAAAPDPTPAPAPESPSARWPTSQPEPLPQAGPAPAATTPSTLAAPAVPPGWLADPTARHEVRFWDGARWTEHVSDAGRPGFDPV